MSLDVYFREDIANILRSVNMAGGSTAGIVHREIEKALRHGRPIETADLADYLELYQQGYRDALYAVAAAFGVRSDPGPDPVPDRLAERASQGLVEPRYVAPAWPLKGEISV